MSRVRSRGTKPEKLVRTALKESGRRFSSNGKRLPGHPDFVVPDIRLAVFVNLQPEVFLLGRLEALGFDTNRVVGDGKQGNKEVAGKTAGAKKATPGGRKPSGAKTTGKVSGSKRRKVAPKK